MTFQEAAVESAQLYYKFLEENGGGLITYRVSKIVPDKNSFKKNEFWLQLDQKPKNTDSLLIRIQNYVYSNEQIKPVVYNSHNRMLKVSLSDSTKGVFDRCRPEDVFVFSDLKFLVRRVEAWYKRFVSGRLQPAVEDPFSRSESSHSRCIIGAIYICLGSTWNWKNIIRSCKIRVGIYPSRKTDPRNSADEQRCRTNTLWYSPCSERSRIGLQ